MSFLRQTTICLKYPDNGQLFKAIKYAAEHPDVKKAIEDMGMRVNISQSPSEFRSFLEAETARLGAVAKKANIVVE